MQSLDEEVNDLINDEDLVDSEDERQEQEEAKEQFELNLTFTTPLPNSFRTLLVVPNGNPQALVKIIMHDRLQEIGKAEATYHEKKHDVLKIQYSAEH